MMRKAWIFGVTLAALVAAPPLVGAQSTTTETKAEQTKGKVSDTTNKMTGASKDAWLTAKTMIALYSDDRVSGSSINVDTQNGTVVLRGKVGSADEKRVAEEVTRSIDGVGTVKNELQVVSPSERKMVNAKDSDLKDSVQRQIKQDTRLKESDIEVRVDAGVVTLMGDVKDIGARARASEVARSVPGVRSVKNDLREKSS
jgi:hyperosmotically inducible periplasmic protein